MFFHLYHTIYYICHYAAMHRIIIEKKFKFYMMEYIIFYSNVIENNKNHSNSIYYRRRHFYVVWSFKFKRFFLKIKFRFTSPEKRIILLKGIEGSNIWIYSLTIFLGIIFFSYKCKNVCNLNSCGINYCLFWILFLRNKNGFYFIKLQK